MADEPTTEELAHTQLFTHSLRLLADFADAHPKLFGHVLRDETFYVFADTPAEFAQLVRELGSCDKVYNESWVNANKRFDDLKVQVTIARDQACRRVQTGTQTVEVPDPDAPMVTREVPVYEWQCPDSILAPQTESEPGVVPGSQTAAV